MRRRGSFFPGLALLIALAPMVSAADAPKEAPGQAKVLNVTYYFLPG